MKFEKFRLEGKTALITGASGLLGFQHALALLESGAEIILTDINHEELLKTQSELKKYLKDSVIESHVMDVTNKEEIVSLEKNLSKRKKNIDILINNAALDPKVKEKNGLDDSSRLEGFDLDRWNLELAVGLSGAFLCSQVYGSQMAKRGSGGVILNIASDLSVISPDQRLYKVKGVSDDKQPVKPVTYSVIKSGLIGLTLYLSTYWADKGVRCNALSPGGIYTNQSEEFLERIKSLIPMGRMANQDEYRSTLQYLCSDASSYLNGQNIVVDGGRSVL